MKYALVLLMVLLAPFASADLITSGVALDATLLYYQPVPAQPGDEVDIYIQLSNDGATPSKKGKLTLIDSGPFIIESDTQRVREFPSIPGQETFLVKVEARISKDASEGENNFRVRVQEDGKTTYIDRDLSITVTGRDSTLTIVEASTQPENILPGEEGTLKVVVENVGETLVRNVDITLDLDGLSLAPIGNSDSKTIDRLAGGQVYTFTFDLISYPDATARAYQLPLTIEYEDETGTEKTQEETVGIVIGTKPELLVYFDEVDVSKESRTGDVVIRFVNKGLAEIKLLEAEVVESDAIEVTSESPILYVGNIDEDDYESADFSIKIAEDGAVMPIKVTYRDALNREYTEQFDLVVHASGNGDSKGFGVVGWVIVIAVIVGIVWWWRKRKKDKR